MRGYSRRLFQLFLAEYGPACHCCGEADPAFLSLGHTWGDGALLHGRVRQTHRLIALLRQRGWPKDEGIAVECFNCNMGAARNGGTCPHRRD